MNFKLRIRIALTLIIAAVMSAHGNPKKTNALFVYGTEHVMYKYYNAHAKSTRIYNTTTILNPFIYSIFRTNLNDLSANNALAQDSEKRTNEDFRRITVDRIEIISQFERVKQSLNTRSASMPIDLNSNPTEKITYPFIFNTKNFCNNSYIEAEGFTLNTSAGVNVAKSISMQILKMTVYPNPPKDFINITISGAEEETAIVSVNSLIGNTIITKTVKLSESIRLDISELSSGIYLVHAITKNGEICKRIVIK